MLYTEICEDNEIRIDHKIDELLPSNIPEEVEGLLYEQYHSPTADYDNGTYLQIGPLVYGGEVQDIKILEQKAVSVVSSTRSNSDFLMDNGEGTASVLISLVFSGLDHIRSGLIPLISLLRLAPIISIKNKLISTSLISAFTEGQVEVPEKKILDATTHIMSESLRLARHMEVFNFLKAEPSQNHRIRPDEEFRLISREEFEAAKSLGCISLLGGVTFDEWDKATSAQPQALPQEGSKATPNDDIAAAGFVPVALERIDVSTHNDLVDSILVNLYVKRISVFNYSKNYLRYYDKNGGATHDPIKAHWLKKLLTKYIEHNQQDLDDLDFKQLTLLFNGDKLLLKSFIGQHDLYQLKIKDAKDTSVLSLNYSISNKLAYSRLAGEAYPTVQFMGTSSGELSFIIRTSNDDLLKKVHLFKSAADFFLRTADKFDRFNGWDVLCPFASLFRRKDQVALSSSSSFVFYPVSFVTSTVDDSPNTRDISIRFAETNANFFSNYGFVLETSSLSKATLYEIYKEAMKKMPQHVEESENDFFLQLMTKGDGTIDENFSLINKDTIIAALLSTYKIEISSNGDILFRMDEPYTKHVVDLIEEARNNPSVSGETRRYDSNTVTDRLANITEEAIQSGGLFFSKTFDSDVINPLIDKNFDIPNIDIRKSLRKYLRKYLKDMIHNVDREKVYQIIFDGIQDKTITLTPGFIDRLFIEILERRFPPFSDRFYDRGSIFNAYSTLEKIALIRGQSLVDKENSDVTDELIKSASGGKVIVFNTDGRIEVVNRKITAYPDFFYITFEDLFGSKWKQFGYTFQDLGIINRDPAAYISADTQRTNVNVVTDAQNMLATKADSPVPPSIIYYRERNFNDIRTGIESQYERYHDSLKVLTVKIPWDITYISKELGAGFIKIDGKDVKISELPNKGVAGLAALLEDMTQYNARHSHKKFSMIASAREMVGHQLKQLQSHLKKDNLSLTQFVDFLDRIMTNNADTTAEANDIRDEYRRFIISGENFQAFVPIIWTVHNDNVSTHVKISGVEGSGFYRTTLKALETVNLSRPKDFLGDALYASAEGRGAQTSLTYSSVGETFNSIVKSTSQFQDNRDDFCRAFPTFRFYIVDFTTGDRLFMRDNFYGWNAVESIDITLDKHEPGLAVIRIADPLHILQGEVLGEKLSYNKGVMDNFILPNSQKSLDSKSFTSRFELSQGRAIQIRGGFSSEPAHLEILFTGRIAEIEYGDMVTIVAQDWKSEFFNKQVDFELTTPQNSSVKDLIVRTIQDCNPAGFGQTYSRKELERIFKAYDIESIDGSIGQALQMGQGTYGGPVSSLAGTAGINLFTGSLSFAGMHKGLDMRLKNVWVQDISRRSWNPYANITTTGWESRSWIVPLQPAWDVLQQASNYLWGFICQVVPYEGEATIFFGRPEQLYYYTRGDPKAEGELARSRKNLRNNFEKFLEEIVRAFKKWDDDDANKKGHFVLSKRYGIDLSRDVYPSGVTSPVAYRRDLPYGDGNQDAAISKIETHGLVPYQHIYSYAELPDEIEDILGGKNSDISSLLRTNMDYNFLPSFAEIAQSLGRENAAYFLLSSFYGLSPDVIQRSFFPTADAVESFLDGGGIIMLSPIYAKLLETNIPGIVLSQYDALVYPDKEFAASVINNEQSIRKDLSDISLSLHTDNSWITSLIRSKHEIVISGIPRRQIDIVKTYINSHTNAASACSANNSFEAEADGKASKAAGGVNHISVPLKTRLPSNYSLKEGSVFINDMIKFYLEASSKNRAFDAKTKEEMNFLSKNEDKGLGLLISFRDTVSANTAENAHANFIVKNLPLFRMYVYYMAEFLRSPPNEDDLPDIIKQLSQSSLGTFPLSLNMKPFRDYHYIENRVDIISNNMVATTREMLNTVVIRYGEDVDTNDLIDKMRGDYDTVEIESINWKTWPSENDQGHIGFQFNDNLTLEEKRIGVYTDINISRPDQAAKVACNVLAKYIRPMYRNSIGILGKHIKPWDHIYINDRYVDILGWVEAERVVHHYNAHMGWVTNIVPHAIVEANPGASIVQRAIIANRWDVTYNLIDWAGWVIVALTAIPTLGASVGLGAALTRGGLAQISKILPPNMLKFLAAKEGQLVGQNILNAAKHAGNTLGQNYVASMRALLLSQSVGFGASELTRLCYLNSISRDKQAPITVTPVLYKGVPLDAGLHGRESSYYSISGKLYWWWFDAIDGMRQAFRNINVLDQNVGTSMLERAVGAQGSRQEEK